MNETALIARVIAVVCLAGDVCVLGVAKWLRWRSMYCVWLFAFGVFNVVLQWSSGLTWLLAVISCAICTIAMIITGFKVVRRWQWHQRLMREQYAEMQAERQRTIEELQRNHRELMQFAWSVKASLAEEEHTDDQ